MLAGGEAVPGVSHFAVYTRSRISMCSGFSEHMEMRSLCIRSNARPGTQILQGRALALTQETLVSAQGASASTNPTKHSKQHDAIISDEEIDDATLTIDNVHLTPKTTTYRKSLLGDYSIAKPFRPISLMSFILKTLERLIFWHVQDTHLTRFPLNKNVFSYREGVSTENALHELISKIEKAFNNKQYALVIFLDISSAFSNTATCDDSPTRHRYSEKPFHIPIKQDN